MTNKDKHAKLKILAPCGMQRNAILREVNGQIAIYDIFSSPPVA